METLTSHQNQPPVTIIVVPFPAQGHLNQSLQISCLLSSYHLTVHYVGSATHNRQAKSRVGGLNPQDVAKLTFHDLPTPSFAVLPSNPDSAHKFPVQLHPAWEATLSQREPFADYLREMSQKYRRVVVIYDPMMAFVVQDVASVTNAEAYALNCIPAISQVLIAWQAKDGPLPEDLQSLPSLQGELPAEIQNFVALQYEHLNKNHRAGDIHNTCRLIEGPYLDLLASADPVKKQWAVGPLLPANLALGERTGVRHRCLEWLDNREPKSVIYITFGTSVSLPNEQVQELALGLEYSKVSFLWVLRDADKGDVFDEEVRKPKLPEGFEERVKGIGMVVREWAPQTEILAHPSTGGFMSHCGWNSCIESITMGVPIAAWPIHSDQPTNAVFVTKILKTGLMVGELTNREELVKASTVKNAVERVMASEEGHGIRKRAEELGNSVRTATEEGGVSRLELESFIAHVTRDT